VEIEFIDVSFLITAAAWAAALASPADAAVLVAWLDARGRTAPE
jgi:hypothetical protein